MTLWIHGRPAAFARPLLAAAALAGAGVVTPAFAQWAGPTLKHPQTQAAQKKAPDAKAAKSCKEYGAGYMRLEGSSTCVKIGGYLRYEAGRSWR